MRTSRFFGILDIISIILLAKQVWGIVMHFNEIPDQILSQVKVFLILALFVSLFASAAGLIANRKFGFITYYVQFPFRLLVWVFSIGFITYLPELFNLADGWFSVLLRICFIAEFFRLYFTIQIHRKQF